MMRRWSRVLVPAVSAVAFAQIASAADLALKAPAYAPPPYTWTGWYVGLNAGAAWGHSDVNSAFSCPVPGFCPYNNPLNLAAFNAAGTGSLSDTAFIGGIQTGYNWQTGNLVAGAEVDFNSFNFHKASSAGGLVPVPFTGESFVVTTDVKTDWLFTARGRLGWAIAPRWLAYATGGLALTEIKLANSFATTTAPPVAGASSSSTTKAGWTVGGGFETAVWGNWTVKAEYLYVNFGKVSTTLTTNTILFATATDNMTTTADLRAHIARVGVNYKFY
jgi:outer membrane immunogenic protein